MQKLPNLPQVNAVVGRARRFGVRVSEPASAGVRGPLARKPARRASSASEALKRVGPRCQNEGHRGS
eukprot:406557-Alexandrium_andersonii.AAC.1